jgi:hypothetical protein
MPLTEKPETILIVSNQVPGTPTAITLNVLSPELVRKYRNSRPLHRPPQRPLQPKP